MTTAPDTITLPVNDMAALIVRCAIQLASLSIRQANQAAKGWTAQERAEGIAHAEKATPCAQDGQERASEAEAVSGRDLSRRNPNYGRVNGDVEDIVYGVKPKRGRKAAKVAAIRVATKAETRAAAAPKAEEAPHTTE